VTLGCTQDLSLQEFEALTVLSAWLANVLAAFRQRDRIVQEKQRRIMDAAELSMARMAHNMNTQFAVLGLIPGCESHADESGSF